MKTLRKICSLWAGSVIILCLVIGGICGYTAFSQTVDRGLVLDSGSDARGQNAIKVSAPDGQPLLLYKNSYALLIGGSIYSNGWPNLPGVNDDIQAVQRILEEQGFQVTVHMDMDKAGIDQAFTDFISEYGNDPDNRILVYFAGHGHTLKTAYGEEIGYIVPADAPNPNYDEAAFLSKAMEMEQIEIYAKRIQAKHALFLFDACFSGSLFSITRAVPEIISYKTSKPVRQFITSGSADETVPDESIFRRQFIRAMQGEADTNGDHYVTGTELGEFLQTTVVNYSENMQHPQYGKIRNPNLDKGDFVFILPFKQAESEVSQIPAPSESTFSLTDLTEVADQEKLVKTAWQDKLRDMETAYAQVTTYEGQDISQTLKVEAWERFLQVFSEDNPYSSKDDELRGIAKQQRDYWNEYVAIPTPTPLPQFAFQVKGVTITGADKKEIEPVHDEYTLRTGETVTIAVDIKSSDSQRLEVAWTTGRGKLPPSDRPVNTYTAATPGNDYVTVYIWDRLTGQELPELSIHLNILAAETPKAEFRLERVEIRNANNAVIKPIDDIYTITHNTTVSIRVDVIRPPNYNIEFAWTTGRGKLQLGTDNTNTYTATALGGDYIIVYIWDTVTGEELPEFPINISVVP